MKPVSRGFESGEHTPSRRHPQGRINHHSANISLRTKTAAHSPGETHGSPPSVDNFKMNVVDVCPPSDVILDVQHDQTLSSRQNAQHSSPHLQSSFRVNASTLRQVSPYFRNLLDPHKFGEGAHVAAVHQAMKETRNGEVAAAESDNLPHVAVQDVGKISPIKSLDALMSDFFNILHGQDLSMPTPPDANLANLLIVADRFDSLVTVRQYFRSRRLGHTLDGTKTLERQAKPATEEKVRQRLFIGIMLENPLWVWHNSLRIIHRGGVGHEVDETAPLWWDLPMRIEEELLFRRECILETIQSLQTHFLGLYTSRDRQCKLGYDNSAECDSYQLGQMLRFFKRIGTLSLSFAGAIIPAEADDKSSGVYIGELQDLIDSMRQCPEYQIDKNHSHCGLRTRLVPLLDLVEYSLTEIGICMHCWQDCREEYAWIRVKRPLSWKRDSVGASMYKPYKAKQTHSHLFKHLDTRDMFLAKERLWTI